MLSARSRPSGKLEEVKLTFKAKSAGLLTIREKAGLLLILEKVYFKNFLFLGSQKSAWVPFEGYRTYCILP